MPSSGLPSGELRAVVATSASNAWAVGGTSSGQSLILHWNGTSWKRVPGAGAAGSLTAVSASSATNAWSVGSESGFGSGFGKTLILHWNGTSWKQVPSPSLNGNVSLTAVAVTSGRNAWAVGAVSTGTSPGTSLILHWNGTAWQRVPSPSPSYGKYGNGLASVAATSATNAWAVGCTDGCPVGGTPLIEAVERDLLEAGSCPHYPLRPLQPDGRGRHLRHQCLGRRRRRPRHFGKHGDCVLERPQLDAESWNIRCHTGRGHCDLRHQRLGSRRHRRRPHRDPVLERPDVERHCRAVGTDRCAHVLCRVLARARARTTAAPAGGEGPGSVAGPKRYGPGCGDAGRRASRTARLA